MNVVRHGTGKPLLLVHGLGGSHHSWDTIAPALAAQRDLVIPDLPGFSITAPLPEPPTIASLADALTATLREANLIGIDAVGSSMGARLVLELARRGVVGNVVSLDPGGFWQGWERTLFGVSIGLSINLLRFLAPLMPVLTANPMTRTLLFAQFSHRPWALSADTARTEVGTFAASPSFDPMLQELVHGPAQAGAMQLPGRTVIGWGRNDLVCLPVQAERAQRAFPSATVYWFERCGHFPMWDAPEETVRLILATTSSA